MINKIFTATKHYELNYAQNMIKDIFTAIRTYDLQYVRDYICAGKDINQIDDNGDSLLHVACTLVANPQIAELLIDAGANIDIIDKVHNSPLHTCISNNNFYIAQLLLQKGFNVNFPNFVGNTPLHFVAVYGQIDMLQLLLKYNPDPFLKNQNEFTALVTAKKFHPGTCYDLLESYQNYRELQSNTISNNKLIKKIKI